VLSQQKSIVWFEKEYAGSAGNVVKSVLLGKTDAGATFTPELEKEPAEVRSKLRTVLETPKISSHPLCAHPRVPRSAQEAVKKAALAIAATPEGAELFRNIRLPSPVAAEYERDYRPLEEVDVKGLSNWGE